MVEEKITKGLKLHKEAQEAVNKGDYKEGMFLKQRSNFYLDQFPADQVSEEAKKTGVYSKENYWTHRLKTHPYDVKNNRNRKFPKLKHGYY